MTNTTNPAGRAINMTRGSALTRAHRWLDDNEPTTVRELRWPVALAWAAALYVAGGWAAATYRAVWYLTGWRPEDSTSAAEAVSHVFIDVSEATSVVLAAVLTVWVLTGPGDALSRGHGPERWRRERLAFACQIGAIILGFALAKLLPKDDYPFGTTRFELWEGLATGGLAGPTEELVLPVALLIVLRAGRLPWKIVLPLLVLMRVSFHIYYGWGSVMLAFWALAMILTYLATRGVVGMIVGHAAFNTTTSLNALSPALGALPLMMLVILAGAIAVHAIVFLPNTARHSC